MLLNQKVVCDNLIAAKDKLISEYAAESRKKDDDYVKELRRQAEEISMGYLYVIKNSVWQRQH